MAVDVEYTKSGIDARAGFANNVLMSELDGTPKGFMSTCAVIVTCNGLTPNMPSVGITSGFGTYPQITGDGGWVRSDSGTDGSGGLGTIATMVFDSDGKHFGVTWDSAPQKCTNGFWGCAMRITVNDPSAIASITVQGQVYTASDFTGSTPPAPPTGLNGADNGAHNAHLAWKGADPTKKGHFIERSSDGGLTFQTVGAVPGTTSEFTDGSANLATTAYQYRISAFNETSVSAPTSVFSIGLGVGCGKTLSWTLVLTPNNGPISGGNTITIGGVDTATTNPGTGQPYLLQVVFGTKRVTPVVINSTTIQVIVPQQVVAGTVNVSVIRIETGEIALKVGAYTYSAGPIISSITTVNGPTTGGTLVQILGAGFMPGSTVYFGVTPSPSVTFINPAEIQAVTPPHGIGAVDVIVLGP